MGGNFLHPLFKAERAIRTYYAKEQWRRRRNAALLTSFAFLLMSLINIYQHSQFMMFTTLLGAVLPLIAIFIDARRKGTAFIENTLLAVFALFFTEFIIGGENDGMAILWVIFLPFSFMMLIDLKKGMILSGYFLVLLVLLFYGPLDFLLRYDYRTTVRLRFPAIYLVDCAVSFICVRALIQDRGKLIETQQKLEYASHHDPLTGLMNRCAYTGFMQNESMPGVENLTVVYMDVNGLHSLNNREGHTSGDRMLKIIAQLLMAQFPKERAYRLGGDEFLLVCINDAEEEVRAGMEAFSRRIKEHGYSIAYGIEHGTPPFQLEKMVTRADIKMLRHKEEYYESHANR